MRIESDIMIIMDIDKIKDDIFSFSDIFFNEAFGIIDANFDFIDINSLIEPKENYFSVLGFLNTTLNHFTNLDYKFASSTLTKLHRDVNNLQKIYQVHKEKVTCIDEIFVKKFLQKTELFQDMNQEILAINKNTPLNDYDKESLIIIKQQYLQMKEIYFEYFQADFSAQIQDLLRSLKDIMNIKAFYLDRLLWLEANKSMFITQQLKQIHKTHTINSKIYIMHRLQIDLPYTDEYKYLEKCLRTYK